MDSSKMVEGSSEECSSSESGWTMYIGSPENQQDHVGEGDDDAAGGVEECRRHEKDIADHENVDSDDSMASDASSGPSGMHLCGYEGKHVGVQEEKEKEKKKKKKKDDEEIKIKTEKEHKSGNRGKSAGKSKKT